MDSLSRKDNRRDLRRALSDLKDDLDPAYDDLIRRVYTQGHQKVRRAEQIIGWIAFAIRPLTVAEIQTALAIEFNDKDLDEQAYPDINFLVSACAGIVTIDQESQLIRFVHNSFQDYFVRKVQTTKFSNAQADITRTCLTYLLFETFEQGYCQSDDDMEKRLARYPLLRYAAGQWGFHARGELEHVKSIQDLIVRFLEKENNMSCSVQAMQVSSHRYEGYSQIGPRKVHGLWLATHFGLTEICKLLLENGCSVDDSTSDGATALHEAANNGFDEVMKILLDKGATVGMKTRYGRTPMHEAARRGHCSAIELLLEHDGDTNTITESGRTALHEVASNGHEAAARLLLCSGANVSARTTPSGWTALHGAVSNGSHAVVRLLLDSGADVSSKTSDEETPLHIAVGRNYVTVSQLLLEANADIETKDRHGETALLIAASKGFEPIVELLLTFKADTKVGNWVGKTALHKAAFNGYSAIVQLLLKNNADPQARDIDGLTVLHEAAWNGQTAAAQLLLQNGADVNSVTFTARTALHGAAANGSPEMVRLLLDSGADVKAKCRTGDKEFDLAAARAEPDSERRLILERTAGRFSSNAASSESTAVQLAAMHCHEPVVKLLVDNGAEMDESLEMEKTSEENETVAVPSDNERASPRLYGHIYSHLVKIRLVIFLVLPHLLDSQRPYSP